MFADDIVICSERRKKGGLDRHKWYDKITGNWDKEGGKSLYVSGQVSRATESVEKHDGTG